MAGNNNPFRADDDEPWPFGTNTGGPIDPLDHIGHLAEYEAIVAAALGPNNLGALVTGDRRMGKTSLLHLVERYLKQQKLIVIRVSAETSDPAVFAARLRDALTRESFMRSELENWSVDLEVSYKGITVKRTGKGRKKPESTDDLFDYAVKQAKGHKVVVVLDEIAVLASGFARNGPEHALEFLRSLRAARQRHPEHLAMILSGSVGLHHVVPDMTGVNDLTPVRVAHLTSEHGTFLAQCLLLGESVAAGDPLALAVSIAEAADNVAFYIHHLVKLAAQRDRTLEPGDVDELVDSLLLDPDDPCHFRHYRDRLSDYYGEQAATAEAVLDTHAQTDGLLPFDDLANALDAVELEPRPSRSELVGVVEQLERDNYLRREASSTIFATSILKRGWRTIQRFD